MMLIQADGRRSKADARRFAEGPGDEDLGHHDRLILHRMMLADPELLEAELFGTNDQLQVFVVALGERLVRSVKGHDEHAVVDSFHSRGHARGSWREMWGDQYRT